MARDAVIGDTPAIRATSLSLLPLRISPSRNDQFADCLVPATQIFAATTLI
jgi:hypothetical protein